jgi:hypothetical protein
MPFLGRTLEPSGIAAGMAPGLYWLLLAVISAAVKGIFVAALYRYAGTNNVSAGFRREDFSMAWQPKG